MLVACDQEAPPDFPTMTPWAVGHFYSAKVEDLALITTVLIWPHVSVVTNGLYYPNGDYYVSCPSVDPVVLFSGIVE